MDLTATYVFHAPAEHAWNVLMDTNAIASCLPGCRGLQPIGNDRYDVELGIAIAAITGDFKGTVAIEEKLAPQSYRLVLEGSGRQGFIRGHARVTLAADGDHTRIHIAAQADVGGMIARVGQRLLEGVGRTMMDRFYACLAKQAEHAAGI